MQVDKFVLDFVINSDNAIKKAKELESTFDRLHKKSKDTKKSIAESFSITEGGLPGGGGTSRSSLRESRRTTNRVNPFIARPLPSRASSIDASIQHEKRLFEAKEEISKKEVKTRAKTSKALDKEMTKSTKAFKSFGGELSSIISGGGIGTLAKIIPGAGLGIAAFGGAVSTARKYDHLFFDRQRLGSSAGQLLGLSRSLSLTGTPGSQIIGALGSISKSQTLAQFTGQRTPLTNLLTSLNVPIATSRGGSRKPQDILLGISKAIEKLVKNNTLSKSSAFNLLGISGFSSGVSNFILQGSGAIKSAIAGGGNGNLSEQQIQNLHDLTKATQQLENQFSDLKIQLSSALAPALVMLEKGISSIFSKITAKGVLNFFGAGILAARNNPLTSTQKHALTEREHANLMASRHMFGYGMIGSLPNKAYSSVNNTSHHVDTLHIHTASNNPSGIVDELLKSMDINNVMQANGGMY